MKLPRLIVLRIWTEADRFRAVAREFEPPRTRAFSAPDHLLSFLLGNDVALRASDDPTCRAPRTPAEEDR